MENMNNYEFSNNDFARNAEVNRVISLNKKNGINNGTFIIYL